jgi:hypothetical protein
LEWVGIWCELAVTVHLIVFSQLLLLRIGYAWRWREFKRLVSLSSGVFCGRKSERLWLVSTLLGHLLLAIVCWVWLGPCIFYFCFVMAPISLQGAWLDSTSHSCV